jgi:membrane associated rhomboid family serine protease
MIPISDSNPSRRFPLVNLSLIAINVIAFLFELSLPTRTLERLVATWGVIPSNILLALANPFDVSPFIWLTLVTSQFLHGGWAHIIGNMLFLFVFGDNIEDTLGHWGYLIFYLLAGIAAALVQIFVMGPSRIPTIGASGAIAGVLGAYLILYPTARIGILLPIFIFFTTIDLPAIFVIGWWFVQQFFYGIGSLTTTAAATGGIAFWAHIGGFITGLVLILPFIGRARRRRSSFYYLIDDYPQGWR